MPATPRDISGETEEERKRRIRIFLMLRDKDQEKKKPPRRATMLQDAEIFKARESRRNRDLDG